MVYQCKLVKYNNDGEEVESTEICFHSSTKRLFSMGEFDTEYGEAMDNINEKFRKYMGKSSGWILENGVAYHYVLMKNLNRLLRSCADGNNTKEICPYCCHGFDKQTTNDEKMEEHMAECFTNGGTKVKMPDVGDNTIVFDQYYQQQVAPYCIYADFESVLKRNQKRKQQAQLS